jgi:hypothetical protein
MSIYEKLEAIQKELNVPKGQTNTFGNYKYRSAEDIVEAAKPVCFKHKTVLFLTDTIEQKGERYYVKATAFLFDTESPDKIEVTASAREEESKKGMDGAQVTGAASSYARKYALNGLFCIDDSKDSDTDEKATEEINRAANAQAHDAVSDLLMDKAGLLGIEAKDVPAVYQTKYKKKFYDATIPDLIKAIKDMEKKIAEGK